MSTWLHRLGLWTSCLAQLIVVLDVSVVNVALPSIQADLGLSEVAASWVALAYSLGFAGLLLVGARLADVVGTARLLAWSVAAFTLASLIGGLATEGWVLIAARAAQGVSAAAASPATFTLLTTTHAEGPERTRAIAVWTAGSLAGGRIGQHRERVAHRPDLLASHLVDQPSHRGRCRHRGPRSPPTNH